MGIVPAKSYYTELDDLEIDFGTAQRINLLGGEPMFDPRSFQLLKKLLDHGNDQCFISFVTNGSVCLNDFQKNILKEFQNLNICFSIDGIGKRFEYMRWPGKWNDLLHNLEQYKTITDNLSVSYTISAVNANGLKKKTYVTITTLFINHTGLHYQQCQKK
jgi:MoaA/NifB/PqqE/SkfB family radical SAM enzyme